MGMEMLSVSGLERFFATSSAQSKAYQWLVNDDLMQTCPDDSHLTQRYILAVLYFSTAGETWVGCTKDPTPCDEEPFLSGEHECAWEGVGCNSDNQVTALHLDEHNMTGTLPAELGSLVHLIELDMDSNALSGVIPSSLGQLEFLEIIDLDRNGLIGSIPEQIYNVSTLRVLDLDGNSLTGTISSDVDRLTQLYYIQLDFNLLTGNIPSQMGALGDLRYVSFFGNNFTAPIPNELCVDGRELFANCTICTIAGCCTACLDV